MRLSIVLFDGFTTLDVVGGYEVLANVPGIEVEFVAAERGVVAADTRRLGLVAYRTFDDVTSTDILYVPGGPGVVPALHDEALLSSVRGLHESSTWTIGICNGVALLAAAGALEGTQVTTNRGWRDRVRAYNVDVVPERFHRDGKVVTGAGVSASIDAGLFLAELIGGEEIARIIQLGIEYYPEPPQGGTTADEAPEAHKAIISDFEAGAADRLANVVAPFAVGVASSLEV
jgi:putative intracellular protease/amidase